MPREYRNRPLPKNSKEYTASATFPGLLPHDWKAQLIHPKAKRNELAYGKELEIETKEYDKYQEVYDIGRRYLGDSFVLKSDGSLNFDRGVEIVGNPLGLSFYQSRSARNMLTSLSAIATSHSNGSCGLHYHVSRNSLCRMFSHLKRTPRSRDGERQATIDVYLYNFLNLLITSLHHDYDTNLPLVKLARRSMGSLTQWANPQPIRASHVSAKLDPLRTRYVALNRTKNTFELRIFRGTLKYSSYVASVELFDAMIRFCSKWEDFESMAVNYRDAYSNRAALVKMFYDYAIEKYPSLEAYVEEKSRLPVRRPVVPKLPEYPAGGGGPDCTCNECRSVRARREAMQEELNRNEALGRLAYGVVVQGNQAGNPDQQVYQARIVNETGDYRETCLCAACLEIRRLRRRNQNLSYGGINGADPQIEQMPQYACQDEGRNWRWNSSRRRREPVPTHLLSGLDERIRNCISESSEQTDTMFENIEVDSENGF